jgi:hypothetical protein
MAGAAINIAEALAADTQLTVAGGHDGERVEDGAQEVFSGVR